MEMSICMGLTLWKVPVPVAILSFTILKPSVCITHLFSMGRTNDVASPISEEETTLSEPELRALARKKHSAKPR